MRYKKKALNSMKYVVTFKKELNQDEIIIKTQTINENHINQTLQTLKQQILNIRGFGMESRIS